MNRVIPVKVLKAEVDGINFADQCDQASSHDFRLRNALREVLQWIETPAYRERYYYTMGENEGMEDA